MADSGAARQARHKRHKAGDHSGCRPGCGGRSRRQDPPGPAGEASPCTDPAAELAALAGRLRDAHVADPGNAAVARVLKDVLLALPAGDEAPDDDPLAELRALAESVS